MYCGILKRIVIASNGDIFPSRFRAAGIIYVLQTGAAIKRPSADACYAIFDINGFNFIVIRIPRRSVAAASGKVVHWACASDGKNAVLIEGPSKIITACAGSDNCSSQKGGFVLRGRILHRYRRRFRGRLGSRLRRGFHGWFRCRRLRRGGLRIAAGHSLRLLRAAVRRPRRDGELNGEDDRKKHGKPFFHILYAPFLCENAIYNHNAILYPSPEKKQEIRQTLYRIFRRVYRFFIFSAV